MSKARIYQPARWEFLRFFGERFEWQMVSVDGTERTRFSARCTTTNAKIFTVPPRSGDLGALLKYRYTFPSTSLRKSPRLLCPHRNLDTAIQDLLRCRERHVRPGRFLRGASVYNIAKITVLRYLISAKPRTPLLASHVVPIESRDVLIKMFGPYRRSFPLQGDRFHCNGTRLCRSQCA